FGVYSNALGSTGSGEGTETVETPSLTDPLVPSRSATVHQEATQGLTDLFVAALTETHHELFQGNIWENAVQAVFSETSVATADLMGQSVDPLALVSDASHLVLHGSA